MAKTKTAYFNCTEFGAIKNLSYCCWAESPADIGVMFMRKAFSLVNFCAPLRRALPYASMRKAFSLGDSQGCVIASEAQQPPSIHCKTEGLANVKAEGLSDMSVMFMRKAFSLDGSRGRSPSIHCKTEGLANVKAEGLSHTSVGQRPTYEAHNPVKAEGLADVETWHNH